jgi:hypothetical protein
MFGNVANSFGSISGRSGVSVFCIDPGETTGWAWACVGYKELASVSSGGLDWKGLYSGLSRVVHGERRFACGEVEVYRGPMSASSVAGQVAQQEAHASVEIACMIEVHSRLSKVVSGGRIGQVTDVVIEDFILRERTKSRNLLSPVRLTAGIVQEVLRSPIQMGLTIQSPSDAKGTVTDERLKALGLWQVGQIHARDACRHLALFLRRLIAE